MIKIIFLNLENRYAKTEINLCNNLKIILDKNEKITSEVSKIEILSANINDVNQPRAEIKLRRINIDKKNNKNFSFFNIWFRWV